MRPSVLLSCSAVLVLSRDALRCEFARVIYRARNSSAVVYVYLFAVCGTRRGRQDTAVMRSYIGKLLLYERRQRYLRPPNGGIRAGLMPAASPDRVTAAV